MKLNIPFSYVRKIYHFADIHIRMLQRHDEYRQVFATVVEQIRADDPTDSLIVIAGDIGHSKTDMSPEMVKLMSEFFTGMAELAPTIVILGNHDLNLDNPNRLDSLTPVLSALDNKNIHYLRHSGIYECGDVDFAVFSIIDDQSAWPHATECRPAAKKIALYHGPVHGATTDIDYTISSKTVEVSRFAGFDVAMLGDIHRYQVLQQRSTGLPEVVYPSSLIQQNHGERLDNHGWCRWDMATMTHRHITVPNEYGFYTMELSNGQYTLPPNLPKNLRLRVFADKPDSVETKKAIAVIRQTYNIIELSLNKEKATLPSILLQTQQPTNNIFDVNNQNELIKNWLDIRHGTDISEDLMEKILKLNKDMNGQVHFEDHSRNVSWKPIKLTFSNMFSYGEGNEVNFADKSGVYGIFAPNASGKSSLIDALIFCLYDKTPRAFRGDHIMNNRRDSFECQLLFEINGQQFQISRSGKRKKTGEVKVDVDFVRLGEDGQAESLNGQDRRDTNSIIRSYVGSYEDFVLTTLSTQMANALFIDKSHAERKDLLIQFMGLNIFDVLGNAANDHMKEISVLMKRFHKSDFSEKVSDAALQIKEKQSVIAELEQSVALLKETRETLMGDMVNLKKGHATPVEYSGPDISAILEELRQIHKKLENETAKLIQAENELAFQQEKYAALQKQHTDIVETYGESILVEASERATQLEADSLSLTNKRKNVQDIRKMSSGFLDRLSALNINPECPSCLENNKEFLSQADAHRKHLSDADESLRMIEETLSAHREVRESLEPLIRAHRDSISLHKQASNASMDVVRLRYETDKVQATIAELNRQMMELESNREAYYKNESAIIHNKTLSAAIDELNGRIDSASSSLDATERRLRTEYGELAVLEATKTSLIEKLKEAQSLEDEYLAYKYYTQAIGRDGVPYDIMTKAIPSIETEINDILSQIVKFQVSLEVDEKTISGKLNYDNERIWPLENSSGMERFVTSIAIRMALLNASNLPKPNFMVIDEGFSALDFEHTHNLNVLFSILKTRFDFTLVISHLEAIRDMVDKTIDIRREDNFSYIMV